MKKLLVWDGDESLWTGTVIDGDIIVLPGNRYDLCEELFNRGVVQSVASYNLLADVDELIHKFGLTNFFLLSQATLDGNVYKSQMIKSIMDSLGLVKNSDVVFIDDNDFNRHEVMDALPGIVCLHPTDDVLQYFTKESYTDEDRNRVRMYRSELSRVDAGKAYGEDRTQFLESLELQAKIFRPGLQDMQRVVDLVMRANRFSAMDRMYNEETLYELYNEGNQLYALHAIDKFGDYGLCGVAHVDGLSSMHAFVISCRLQGKGLGSAFLGSLINRCESSYRFSLDAFWVATEYNAGVRSLFEWYKFKIVDQDEVMWAYRDYRGLVDLPHWIKVTYEL